MKKISFSKLKRVWNIHCEKTPLNFVQCFYNLKIFFMGGLSYRPKMEYVLDEYTNEIKKLFYKNFTKHDFKQAIIEQQALGPDYLISSGVHPEAICVPNPKNFILGVFRMLDSEEEAKELLLSDEFQRALKNRVLTNFKSIRKIFTTNFEEKGRFMVFIDDAIFNFIIAGGMDMNWLEEQFLDLTNELYEIDLELMEKFILQLTMWACKIKHDTKYKFLELMKKFYHSDRFILHSLELYLDLTIDELIAIYNNPETLENLLGDVSRLRNEINMVNEKRRGEIEVLKKKASKRSTLDEIKQYEGELEKTENSIVEKIKDMEKYINEEINKIENRK